LPTPNVESGAAELLTNAADPPTGGNTASTEAPVSEAPPCAPPKPGPPVNPPNQRRIEPLAADRYGIHFTADGDFCRLLERVRGLAGHRNPSGDLLTLLRRGLEAYERELEKERFAVGRKPRVATRAKRPRSKAPLPPNAGGEPAVAEA